MPSCYDLGFDFLQFECSTHNNEFVGAITKDLNNFVDFGHNLLLDIGIQLLYFEVLLEDFNKE